MNLSINTTAGDTWGIAGLLGLHAAGQSLDCEPLALAAAVEQSLSLKDGWFAGLQLGPVNPEIAAQLHEGLARSLVGHGKHRRRAEDGGIEWIPQHAVRKDWFMARRGAVKSRIKLTRGILPNWVNTGEGWPLEQVAALWFAPLASVFLPINVLGEQQRYESEAIIVAPFSLDFEAASEICRVIQPDDPDDCYPASAADAVLGVFARLRAAGLIDRVGGATAWRFGWTAANNKFREVCQVIRGEVPADATLDKWRTFADRTKPIRLEGKKPFSDLVRGLAADNLLAGRRAYEGFDRLCKHPLHQLRNGSRALLDTLLT